MRFFRSFIHAFSGLRQACLHEKNFRIQLVIALITIIAGILFSITTTEWLIMLVCCGMVLSLEIMNSSLESLCDFNCTTVHPAIKRIKDMAAAAVLIASATSAIAGCLIFIPYVVALFH